jgi:hypothetical protein
MNKRPIILYGLASLLSLISFIMLCCDKYHWAGYYFFFDSELLICILIMGLIFISSIFILRAVWKKRNYRE